MTLRPKFLSVIAALALFAIRLSAQIPSGPPLGTGKAKFLGSAYSSPNQTLYFERYWNQVTPENAGKWGSVEGTRNVMNWGALDAAYNFAKANGFPFKFHTLIWGAQQPAWIRTLPADQQLAEIQQWFAAVAARYPALDFIDVVNEAQHDPPNGSTANNLNTTDSGNYIAALGGAGATGWDWVITAFQLARQYFPNAKLLINEYSVTNSAASAATYVQIINLLKARHLIDGIGIQGHAFSTTVSATTTRTNLATIAATNLPIYISELDIDGLADQVQLAEYQRVFPIFWEHPAVAGITLWGWRPGHWRTNQGAPIVAADANNTERPSLQWLRNYVATSTPPLSLPPSPQEVAAGGNRTLHAAISGTGTFTYQWKRNGADLEGATNAALALANLQPANAGIYSSSATATSGAVTVSHAIVGVTTTSEVIGDGVLLQPAHIAHPNGNIFNQVLITGAAETITALPGEITRTSFIDLTGDIVQIEFSGAGSLSVVLDGNSAAAPPENYHQPGVNYVKGHPGLVIVGADETTNVGVFSVGRATAVDPTGTYNILLPPSDTNRPANNGSSLFEGHGATVYDGVADLAFVAIQSSTGKFGGLRSGNASYFATKGLTGVYAPGIAFSGPVFIGDISASDSATPVIMIGSSSDTRITGGDLQQANSQPVQASGLTQLKFTAGTDAHGNPLTAKTNRAVLLQDGSDVTLQVVVYPVP